MNWVQRFVRWLAGGHDATYHRLASEQTARNLDATRRKMRADQLHRDALALRLDVRSRGTSHD